jgi:ferredoxin-NADP reductase
VSPTLIELRLQQIRLEAQDICSYELVSLNGANLPTFTAGAHIDVHMPGAIVRSYSIASSPAQHASYQIAVQRDAQGRGGSKWLHDHIRVGQSVTATLPKNEFELVEEAKESVFIAGGIGITPILSMIRRLNALGKSWKLHYATRSRKATAFMAELAALDGGRDWVQYAMGDERLARISLKHIVEAAPAQAHFYCCGPTRMIDDFIAAASTRNPAHIHFERFSASGEAATAGGFEVVLAKTGRRLSVAAGQTVLDALLDSNVQIAYACSNGICGTCMTTVLSGTPDHRDDFLSDEEKKSGKSIMVCCSGSLSPELVLDL